MCLLYLHNGDPMTNQQEQVAEVVNMGAPVVVIPNAFPPEGILEVLKYSDFLEYTDAKVGAHEEGEQKDEIRKNKIKWITPQIDERGTKIWGQVDMAIQQASRDYFGFDIFVGGTEPIQYTEYSYIEENEIKDHYDWHMDSTVKTPNPFDRKLSFSLQLSHEDEYKGCDLEFTKNVLSEDAIAQCRAKGSLVIFPSFLTHRVTPITGGTRKALVGWCRGPCWR